MIERDLIYLDNIGDLCMSEMTADMRLHTQEVTRYTAGVVSSIRLSRDQIHQFKRDCESYGIDPLPFLIGGVGRKFSPTGLFMMKICAKTHDVGKPFFRHISSLERTLTDDEYEAHKLHANFTRIVIRSWLLDDRFHFGAPKFVHFIADTAAAHQERFDGTGYPDGRKGTDIPFASRILAIADAASAVLNPRSYQEPISLPDCLEKLRPDAGTHFDPELFKAAMKIGGSEDAEAQVSGEWKDPGRFTAGFLQTVHVIDGALDRLANGVGDKAQLEEIRRIVKSAIKRH